VVGTSVRRPRLAVQSKRGQTQQIDCAPPVGAEIVVSTVGEEVLSPSEAVGDKVAPARDGEDVIGSPSPGVAVGDNVAFARVGAKVARFSPGMMAGDNVAPASVGVEVTFSASSCKTVGDSVSVCKPPSTVGIWVAAPTVDVEVGLKVAISDVGLAVVGSTSPAISSDGAVVVGSH